MSENKNSQLAKETNPNKKYKKYIKLIIYIFLILILLSVLISVYIKVKEFISTQSMHYIHTVDTNLNKENQKLVISEKIDSVSTYDLEDLIQSHQKFQKDVYTKFNELNDQINLMYSNRGAHITESQTIFIDNKPKNPSSKNPNSKDLNVIFNLIMDLNTNKPFLTALDALNNSGLVENNLSDIKILYEVSTKGIPTSYDLATTFEDLQPNIKREIYSLGKDWLSRLKYYLSFFVVIQKENILSYNDNTLDNNLNKIKQMLIENKPEYALKIVDENNLSQLIVLNNWYKDLTYRVKANTLVLKLKQYFLNS